MCRMGHGMPPGIAVSPTSRPRAIPRHFGSPPALHILRLQGLRRALPGRTVEWHCQ